MTEEDESLPNRLFEVLSDRFVQGEQGSIVTLNMTDGEIESLVDAGHIMPVESVDVFDSATPTIE